MSFQANKTNSDVTQGNGAINKFINIKKDEQSCCINLAKINLKSKGICYSVNVHCTKILSKCEYELNLTSLLCCTTAAIFCRLWKLCDVTDPNFSILSFMQIPCHIQIKIWVAFGVKFTLLTWISSTDRSLKVHVHHNIAQNSKLIYMMLLS